MQQALRPDRIRMKIGRIFGRLRGAWGHLPVRHAPFNLLLANLLLGGIASDAASSLRRANLLRRRIAGRRPRRLAQLG